MSRSAFAFLVGFGMMAHPLPGAAAGEPEPVRPAWPRLSAEQTVKLDREREVYRREVEGRVARGEITADAGRRLLSAREWLVAEQLWGLAPVNAGAPQSGSESGPPQWSHPYLYQGFAYDFHTLFPYFFFPSPAVWGPRAYTWGPTLCTGGWGTGPGLGVCR